MDLFGVKACLSVNCGAGSPSDGRLMRLTLIMLVGISFSRSCAADSYSQTVETLSPVIVEGHVLHETISAGALGSRSVLDTPFSVFTVVLESLNHKQPITLADALFSDPSVTAAANPYASGRLSPIRVRGLQVDWRNFRINGIPADSWGFEWPLGLMERVDVLKGATGFMHGFGLPGGMVNYQTKQPLSERALATQVNWRTESVFSESLDYSDRAGENGCFGYRANLSHDSGGTYNGGDIEQLSGALSLEAKVHDLLKLHGEFIYMDRDLSREAPEFGFSTSRTNTAPEPVSGKRDFSIEGTYWDVEYLIATADAVFTPHADWTLTLRYAYSEKEANRKKPFAEVHNAAGDYSLYNYQFDGGTLRHFTQGLVEGEFHTGQINHQIVAGASWENSRTDASEENYNLLGLGSLLTGNQVLYPFTPHDAASTLLNEITQTSMFISDTAEVLPGLSLLAGLRWSDYEQITRTTDYRKDSFTPTIAVLYKPQPSTTLYASYVEALEPGSVVNGPRYINSGETLPPVVSQQYEAGIKTSHSIWSGSLSIFRLERAAELDEVMSENLFKRTQDGLTVYQGAEVSTEVQITSRLRVSGGFLWLDATYEELSHEQSWREGNRVELSPRYQAVLMAEYDMPAVQGLSVHAGVQRQDGFEMMIANKRNMHFPSYTVVQAGICYTTKFAGRDLEMKLDLNNLLNEKAWTPAGILPPPIVALGLRVKW